MINQAAAPVSRASRPTPSPRARPVGRRAAAARVAAATPQACRRIGLAFPGDLSHWHDVQLGITAAARDRGWQVVGDVSAPRSLAWWLRQPLDGLIAAVTTRAELRAARAAHFPVVNVSQALEASGLPLVTFDNEAIGREAADHLLAEGYVRGGVFGVAGAEFSRLRRAAFAARLAAAGVGCDAFEMQQDAGVDSWEAIAGWLQSLPPGTGVFAVHDRAAGMLLEVCRRLAIAVPGRLGMLGTGDFADAEAALPALSSIRRNGDAVGREACAALERLLVTGRTTAVPSVFIPPAGVVGRESTAGGGGDPVRRALLYVRGHISERFDIAQLARKLRVSRRTLERGFRDACGETPRLRLLRMRAEAALAARAAAPGMPLAAVARAAGFSSVRHLQRTFAALQLDALPPCKRSEPSRTTPG